MSGCLVLRPLQPMSDLYPVDPTPLSKSGPEDPGSGDAQESDQTPDQTPDQPSDQPSEPVVTDEPEVEDPAPLEFDLGQSLRDSWTQLEVFAREIPNQSQRAMQQTWAVVQLRLGGQARDLQEQLSGALAAARISGELEPLERQVMQVAEQLTPAQMEVLIEALPLAADRALVASSYVQGVDKAISTDPQAAPSDRLDLGALDPYHRTSAARAYGLSGLPIVIGTEDRVRVDASGALVSAIVSIQIAGATAATALSFVGTPELRRLLKADDQLRSQAMGQGRKLLPPEENWQLLKQLLNRSDSSGTDPIWDGPLALTQLGIEGAQLAEFIGEQIRSILKLGLLRALTPPILMEALQLLTSDLLFAVGISMEATLESTGAARRVELVLEALPKAQRIPSPYQVWEQAPAVTAEADRRLRPLLAKQIGLVANGLDPQMRNTTLNQIGQQLNLWNPFQFISGWQGREWLTSVAQRLQELELSYPDLPCLQIYASGLEEALEVGRVMEQARILRSTAQRLDLDGDED